MLVSFKGLQNRRPKSLWPRNLDFSTKPREDQFCPLDLLHFLWLQELSDQAGSEFENSDVRWVITVPAIWKQPAKQFMRQAAYQVSAGLGAGGGPKMHTVVAVTPLSCPPAVTGLLRRQQEVTHSQEVRSLLIPQLPPW